MIFNLMLWYLRDFLGLLMCGGDEITSYVPNVGIREVLHEHKKISMRKLK